MDFDFVGYRLLHFAVSLLQTLYVVHRKDCITLYIILEQSRFLVYTFFRGNPANAYFSMRAGEKEFLVIWKEMFSTKTIAWIRTVLLSPPNSRLKSQACGGELVNIEFCDFCCHFNDLDDETCLYCGADLRPDNKKASEPEKGTNAKGYPWLGILVLAVLIYLFIRLL